MKRNSARTTAISATNTWIANTFTKTIADLRGIRADVKNVREFGALIGNEGESKSVTIKDVQTCLIQLRSIVGNALVSKTRDRRFESCRSCWEDPGG